MHRSPATACLRGAITPGGIHLRSITSGRRPGRDRRAVPRARRAGARPEHRGRPFHRAPPCSAPQMPPRSGCWGSWPVLRDRPSMRGVAHPSVREPLAGFAPVRAQAVTYWPDSTFAWKRSRRHSQCWRTTARGPGQSIESSSIRRARPSTWSGNRTGTGIVEGWRGSVVHRIEVDESGRLAGSRSSTHRSSIGRRSRLHWPTRSCRTSPSPTRASTCRTRATICESRSDNGHLTISSFR